MTILLVDSDKNALDWETKRLMQQQYAATISLYSNAEDAIRFVRHHDVDLLFTRSVLVDMTGQELIDKIHCFKPKTECHILSGNEAAPFERFLNTQKGTSHYLNGKGEKIHTNRASGGQDMKPGCSFQTEQKEGDIFMTERELRSLSRKELLEIMIEQGKELETCKQKYEKDREFLKTEHEKDREFLKSEYEKEISVLKKELARVKETLQKREIAIDEAGSIAVAALQVNGVFEAAQAASQQYIENIRSLNERQTEICARREVESRSEAEKRLKETESRCADMEYTCRKKCEAMEAEAKQKADAYWAEVSRRLQSFYENHQELKKLLNFSLPNIPL